jgi:anti-sigma factor RsiW
MTCKELVELITDYLENKLSLPQRIRFEKHLAECKDCTTYLKQMQQTIRLVGHLSEDAIAPANRQELLKLFRAWKNG